MTAWTAPRFGCWWRNRVSTATTGARKSWRWRCATRTRSCATCSAAARGCARRPDRSGEDAADRVALRDAADVDLVLEVGEIKETVTVSAAGPIVDTKSSTIDTRFRSEMLEKLPTSPALLN